MDRIKEELIYLWTHSFLYEIIFKIKTFFKNFKLYLPILLNDQWWDYGYFEDLIIHKLKDIEKEIEKIDFAGLTKSGIFNEINQGTSSNEEKK